MPPRGLRPAGLVLVDKPAGPSSFALVRRLRDKTGARAGHAGTLDPFATGLLLVLLGAATRLAQYLVGLDKRYLAEVDLSRRTSTGDPEGGVVEEHEPPSAAELERAVAGLRGEVELRVPAASAVKVGGQRAYRLARRGIAVEMPVRRSTVHTLEVLAYDGRVAQLDLRVSSGTYVRALADVLGGHCRTLRRTEVGPFLVADADPGRVLSPAEALPFLPAVDVGAEGARLLRSGRAIPRPAEPWPVPGTGPGPRSHDRIRALVGGELVAIARVEGDSLAPETVLPP